MPHKQPRKYPIFLAVFALALTFSLPLTLSLPFGAQAQAQSKKSKKADKHYQKAEELSADYTYSEAIRFYEKAAKLGDVRAQRQLGEMYEIGQGVSKSCSEAAMWYSKAAAGQGDSSSQYKLGRLYYRAQGGFLKPRGKSYGRNRCQDYTEAAWWFRAAAKQGHVEAKEALAEMYREGLGFEQDDTKAAEWSRKAAEQRQAEPISEEDRERFEWTRQQAEQEASRQYGAESVSSPTFAQQELAKMYEQGRGIRRDCTQSLYWSFKNKEDISYHAKLYEKGTQCIKQDRNKAIALYDKALQNDKIDKEALRGLARIFAVESEKTYQQAKTLLRTKNYKAAVPLLHKAVKQQNTKAMGELGDMYLCGRGVKLDRKIAVSLYIIAKSINPKMGSRRTTACDQ